MRCRNAAETAGFATTGGLRMAVYLFPPKRGDCSSEEQQHTEQQHNGVAATVMTTAIGDLTTMMMQTEGTTGEAGRDQNGTSNRHT